MQEVSIPFTYKTPKEELKSFYLSFLIRCFVIKGKINYSTKIKRIDFIEAMKDLGWNKKRIKRTWEQGNIGDNIKYITSDFLILNGKTRIIQDRGFITRIEGDYNIGFYKFCQFITEIRTLRPVKQDNDFKSEFKFKKSKLYNQEIFKRSLEKKKGRGQRKLSNQNGCCLKTINNRLKKSKNIKTIKRYDSYNGFRINKTNLYFNLKPVVFLFYYMKNNTTKKRRFSLNSDHISLIKEKALFLNNCLNLNKSNNIIYDNIQKLNNL